jgi:ATP-dependent protease Clp ATPase subunit
MVKEQQEVLNQINRIIQIYKTSEGAIRPHFILTGPSGSGKSFLAQKIADDNEVNYLEINAAQLTKEGTSGNSLSKALSPLSSLGSGLAICFVDEFDKLFISGNSNGHLAHETTNGVQNEFLKVLESRTASVFADYGKYMDIPIDKVLFIFAGAFNGEEDIGLDRLRDFGIKTEFLGRVGLIYNMKKLSLESMYQTLLNSQLLANYLRLFPTVQKDKVINDIMEVVAAKHEQNTLGIRVLHTLLNRYFINNGCLGAEEVTRSTFQETLSFEANSAGVIQ